MNLSVEWYLLEGINPEPWTTSEVSLIRRSGKMIPVLHKREGLRSYQEAVKEAFERSYGQLTLEPSIEYEIDFYFWRQLALYESDSGRMVRRHRADATNMQKATEDALQGLLFKNDNQVQSVRSVIMEQGNDTKPAILICRSTPPSRPSHITDKRNALDRMAGVVPELPAYEPPGDDLF